MATYPERASTFSQRLVGALALRTATYEEVERDKGALGQAILVVVLASLAAGVGGLRTAGPGMIVIGILGALLGWIAWAFLTLVIGTKLLPEPQTRSDIGELLRTIGFSSAPGLLRVLGVIPGLFVVINFVASVWMLVAMIVAVRTALDYKSTGRAVLVAAIGWLVYLLIAALVFYLGRMMGTA